LQTGELESELLGHSDSVCYLAAYKDLLYSGSWDKTIRVWNIHVNTILKLLTKKKTKQCIQILKGHTLTISCISVDETGIYTSSFDRTIRIWDDKVLVYYFKSNIKTFLCRQVWTGHTSRVLTFLRHNDLLYSTSLDKIIKVWNIQVFIGNALLIIIDWIC
jgi:F-box/WD-40 domain protein MET30